MSKKQTKEEVFVRAYLANGMNATNAAKTAGFSKKSAHERVHPNKVMDHAAFCCVLRSQKS